MRIIQINATCGIGSTGKICVSISELLSKNNIDNIICYSSGLSSYPKSNKYMTDCEVKLGALESRIFGNYGFNSSFSTKRLIEFLKQYQPDIIHLHNIHSHNCNLQLLFDYIKSSSIKVIWTFHDCWAFTGCCTYFSNIGCEKWKTDCCNCPKAHEFSWFFDNSAKLLDRKRKLLDDIDLTIVTPSIWLAELVADSFLKKSKIETINNGINLDLFKPTSSSFRNDFHIKASERIVLGVGFEWGHRKGIDIFNKLADQLSEQYRIVLVGTNEMIEKQLSPRIISIHRTRNQEELAAIYSSADVFVNPTREDNYPTVNMEALACGTPVVTFRTGGSPEIIDETCGIVVEQEDVNGLIDAINSISNSRSVYSNNCLNRAKAFDQNICFEKYIDLYKRIEVE